jgi:hypothetical protein
MASEHEVLEQQFAAAVERLQAAFAELTNLGTGRSVSHQLAGVRFHQLIAVADTAAAVARNARFVADSILEPLFRD